MLMIEGGNRMRFPREAITEFFRATLMATTRSRRVSRAFSADFFGPVSEYASKGLAGSELEALVRHQDNKPQVRGAALFLHFDNLGSDFQSNSNFDFLFNHLLDTTRNLLGSYNSLPIDERTRKTLTLVTLGASLHAVQDFYSHSDWIHNGFDLAPGSSRTPTRFEYRDKHGDPDQWPFRVQSGIYPPVPGVANTHTHMNHDNSSPAATPIPFGALATAFERLTRESATESRLDAGSSVAARCAPGWRMPMVPQNAENRVAMGVNGPVSGNSV